MTATRGRVDLQPERLAPINMNHYATKKSVAESMLDVALLMANASQMKAMLEQGPGFKYYIAVLVLIGVSLLLQILAGALFVVMGLPQPTITVHRICSCAPTVPHEKHILYNSLYLCIKGILSFCSVRNV
uniref:Ninjurin 2 n=1 Tax=Paramormyrops kingsleyae TaxID=1676925 RepID=A0A3B3R1Y6_9TELE